ncbi:hypothetical protein L873DRAFT_1802452 [Choiromyces venosus 120613-1]|uniref:Uncharacterized protein n=1 Tax=Choiromyces venosus 120613-1 TaxID=1336337 RepID=A0A3N4JUL1_9PEZI|nr:hypothetical protein L873DRAFT_1802452 [Choiromyces venosus 120613-1]
MAPRPFPIFAPSLGNYPSPRDLNNPSTILNKRTDYLPRSSAPASSSSNLFNELFSRAVSFFTALEPSPSALEGRDLEPRGSYVRPKSMTAGVLVVFCLLGASIGLMVLWLFVRKGGFMWKESDWEDYKSSVLRRPAARPDDAITVFSDGSARRAGGSTMGARTVVLGELDTTYTKSEVIRGPRAKEFNEKKGAKSVVGGLWAQAQDAFGRLRGGEGDAAVIHRPRRVKRQTREADIRSVTSMGTFVDNQEPARPAGWKPEDSDLGNYPDMTRGQTIIRHPPSALKKSGTGRSRNVPGRRYQDNDSDDSDTSSSSSSDSDSEDESVTQSALGMAKGTKVYTHPYVIGRQQQQQQERSGISSGGTYGVVPPAPPMSNALVPIETSLVHMQTGMVHVPRGGAPRSSRKKGYRKGSAGSLSSDGSMRSSNA